MPPRAWMEHLPRQPPPSIQGTGGPWRAAIGGLFGALCLSVATNAAADVPAPAAQAATVTEPRVEAPVLVLHRKVATLRAPLLGIPPVERARHSEERLVELLDRPGTPKLSVTTVAGNSAILLDGKLGLLLTPDDADTLDGETLEQATQTTRTALERVIAETSEARNHDRRWHAVVRSGLATLVLLLLVVVVRRTRSWLVRRLTSLFKESTARLTAASMHVLHPARLFQLSRWCVRAISTALLLVASYRWGSFVLNQFPYTRPWGEDLDGYLLGIALRIGGGIVHAVPDLLVAFVIFLLARGLLAVLGPIFDGIEKHRISVSWIDADTAKPTRRIVSLLVWAFAAVMAYPYLPGASSEAFKGVSVLMGLMITLGGSSLFGQAASGFILLYSRTLRIGEFVRVGEYEGTVTELGVFTTKISTGLGEFLTLPNALVLSVVTRNYSRPAVGHGFMLRTKVTIGYDAPWRQVQGMLLEAARRTPGVGPEPAPQVFQTALSDFYVEYQLVCQAAQTSARSRAEAIAALNANVIDVFNEYGVQIMSPHYFSDPSAPKTVPKSAWHAAPAPAAKPEADDNAPRS